MADHPSAARQSRCALLLATFCGVRLGLWRPPPSEVALAVVVTAAMAFDLGQAAEPALALVLVVAAGSTLAWRLRVPLLPVVAVCGVDVLLMATAPGEYGPQTVVIGALVSVYTLAAHTHGRTLAAGSAVSLLALWVAHVATGEGDAADFLPYLLWAGPWGTGRLVRRETRRAAEAGARAALLEVEAREAASRERDRIARELHDVVGHAVSLMVVQAGAERMSLGPGSERTRQALESVEGTGRTALAELRAMLGVLRGGPDDEGRVPAPDLSAVPALVDAMRAAGLDVELTTEPVEELQPGLGLALYRIVQEALTNALRHGTGHAQLCIQGGRDVRISVRNPVGPAESGGAGVGLVGLRERAEAYGGQVTAGRDGTDWLVEVVVPVRRVP